MPENVFADPLNEHITSSSFAQEKSALYEKIESYRKHPLQIRIRYVLFFLIPLLVFGIYMGYEYLIVMTIVFSVLAGFMYYAHIKALQHDLIMLLLCEKNNWAFNPEKDHVRALHFGRLFPDIFQRGEAKSRTVDNQIWGEIGKHTKVSFWSGLFHYEIPTENTTDKADFILPHGGGGISGILYAMMADKTSERTDSDKSIFEKQVYVLELPAVIPYSFSLSRSIAGDDLKTESIEFNKTFSIIMHEKSKQAEAKVIQALSPAVQVRLLDFAEKFSLDSITFQHNCMVVMFNQTVWEPKHTNFLKNVMIDVRDLQHYERILEEMVALPLEMRKYLD